MFYICPKCKRRWQYPLNECPYCLILLDKMESKTAKVSGVIKVTIPTLFHPEVPFYILLLEDESSNLWAYKSEIEYKIGDEFKYKPCAQPGAVAVWRVKYDVQETIAKALELIGGVQIKNDSKIVVLPTVAKASHAYFRDNTSPEFLTVMIQTLLDYGIKTENIVVASQSFDETPVAAAAQKSGLIAACAKFSITPVDLATTEFVKLGEFMISKPVVDADLIINLAMEKIGQSNACQNLLKVVKKENYLGQKYLSSDAQIIATIEPLLDKMMTVAEAENVQRSNKLTTYLGLVLVGHSSRNVDRVFNEIAKSFKVPEIVKDIDLAVVPVAGRTIKEVQYNAEIF